MEIKQAILHILDREAGNLICSQTTLDLKEFTVKQYLDSVLKRLEKADYKQGVMNEQSLFAQKVKGSQHSFVDGTTDLAQVVFDSLSISEDAPSGDLLFFEAEKNEKRVLGLVKFNYKPSYTHHVTYVEELMKNNIILNKTIFPSTSQRIEECVLVDMESFEVSIIEKKYSFEGDKRLFFTERLLEIDPTPTVAEKMKMVKRTVKEIAEKYNEEPFVSMSQTQQAVYESIESEGIISTEKIADKVFEHNESAKMEYKEKMAQTKFTEEIPYNIPKYEKNTVCKNLS